MDISLKSVKIAKFASEETVCFQATVYLDGKRALVASNDGRGGSNRYDGDTTALDAYAATLPPVDFGVGMSGEFTPDADWVVGIALTRWQVEKDLKRKIYALMEKQVYEWNVKPTVENIERVRKSNNIDMANVINIMPIDAAVRLLSI
jgi:hypothetical protein